ncbi:hypothetical protein ACFQH6_14145 [Halobacteriaceae archaeon GCM10025711]
MGIIDLHFHDSEFTFAPHIGDETAEPGSETGIEVADGTDGEYDYETDSGSGRSMLGPALGLVFLVVAALVVRKMRGGDDEQQDLEEFDVS